MNEIERIKALDEKAGPAGLPGGRIDVSGGVIARLKAGAVADEEVLEDYEPIRLLAGVSIAAVAAAAIVAVVVWLTVDLSTESMDMTGQQTAGWVQ